MKIYEYNRSDLCVIDVLCSDANACGQERLEQGELANRICEDANGDVPTLYERFAPDYSGPMGPGNVSTDFSVLIERSRFDAWKRAAELFGCTVNVFESEDATAPHDGHYGDGRWNGVDLVSRPNSDRVYWIER